MVVKFPAMWFEHIISYVWSRRLHQMSRRGCLYLIFTAGGFDGWLSPPSRQSFHPASSCFLNHLTPKASPLPKAQTMIQLTTTVQARKSFSTKCRSIFVFCTSNRLQDRDRLPREFLQFQRKVSFFFRHKNMFFLTWNVRHSLVSIRIPKARTVLYHISFATLR